jgi:hypothetical protein
MQDHNHYKSILKGQNPKNGNFYYFLAVVFLFQIVFFDSCVRKQTIHDEQIGKKHFNNITLSILMLPIIYVIKPNILPALKNIMKLSIYGKKSLLLIKHITIYLYQKI